MQFDVPLSSVHRSTADKPSIIPHLSSYNMDAEVGDPVVLSCASSSIPTPVIYWKRTGGASSTIRNYGLIKNVSWRFVLL